MSKSKAISVSTMLEDMAVKFDFANGESLTIEVSDLSPEIVNMATLHGLKQKLGDAAAIPANPETGKPASIDEKFAAVKTVYERLTQEGEWNAPREGGGGAGSLLYRALCIKYDGRKSPEMIRDFLDGLDKKQQAQLRAEPSIASIIDGLRTKPDPEKGEALLEALEDF